MKWFMNLSIRLKITVVFGLLFALLLFIVYYAFDNVNTIRTKQEKLSGKYFQIQSDALRLRDEVAYFRMELLQAATNPSDKSGQLERKFISFNVSIEALFKNLSADVKEDDTYAEHITALAKVVEDYRQKTERHLNILRSRISQAEIDTIISQQSSLHQTITAEIALLNKLSQKDITESFQETNLQSVKTIVLLMWTAVVFLIVIGIIIKQSNNIISEPLKQLASVSTNLSLGDVETDIAPINRSDEIGRLFSAFRMMLISIKEVGRASDEIAAGNLTLNLAMKSDKDAIIRSLNTMAARLRTVIADSKDSIEIISHATNKIFGAVSQLSASSNETATAIGETTVTIEEVKKTSEVLSKKAREINTIAQKASEISEAGLRSTEDTIQGIQNIGSQMETIGESIIKLSEQSRAIGDIIASVNDLAEQSNLLAVNAAIEAARAGEHGKSFVVVAQEIKSLAQQSKQATAQVKSVLNDIQNAINSTVLATEQGEKIVNAGVQLSRQTRESIQTLADTITRFTDISIQATASSQEQFIGMEQVAIAMDNIKVASSQNAVITRDLEHSAKNLQILTDKLRDTISVFRV